VSGVCLTKQGFGDFVEAKWHTREEVRNALTFNEYKTQQQSVATKIHQTCAGEERKRGSSVESRVDVGELPPMFVPGPYAIAHHLISTWAAKGPELLLNKI
jgi:NAD+ diphosphatase